MELCVLCRWAARRPNRHVSHGYGVAMSYTTTQAGQLVLERSMSLTHADSEDSHRQEQLNPQGA